MHNVISMTKLRSIMNTVSCLIRLHCRLIINIILQALAYSLIYIALYTMNTIQFIQSVFSKIFKIIWVQQFFVTLILGCVCSVLFYFVLGASEIESHGRYLSQEKYFDKAGTTEIEIILPPSNLNKSQNVQKCKSTNTHECEKLENF